MILIYARSSAPQCLPTTPLQHQQCAALAKKQRNLKSFIPNMSNIYYGAILLDV